MKSFPIADRHMKRVQRVAPASDSIPRGSGLNELHGSPRAARNSNSMSATWADDYGQIDGDDDATRRYPGANPEHRPPNSDQLGRSEGRRNPDRTRASGGLLPD